MALTQADKTELLNAIKAESQSVDELTQVTSLDGIVSLPAIRGTEVVSAPVSLLRKPAEDAAKAANAAATRADSAATTANTAANTASDAAKSANIEAQGANAAAQAAKDATNELQAAIDAARCHPVVLVNDILGDPERTFAGWVEAKDALAEHAGSDGDDYISIGCVLIFKGIKRWESWQFIGHLNPTYPTPRNGYRFRALAIALAVVSTMSRNNSPSPLAITPRRLPWLHSQMPTSKMNRRGV